jgi:hypothetical protein
MKGDTERRVAWMIVAGAIIVGALALAELVYLAWAAWG